MHRAMKVAANVSAAIVALASVITVLSVAKRVDAQAGYPDVAYFGDQEDCPCLTQQEIEPLIEDVPRRQDVDSPGTPVCLDTPQVPPGACIPSSYGSGCRAWEEGVPIIHSAKTLRKRFHATSNISNP